jgi:uncharacterized protein
VRLRLLPGELGIERLPPSEPIPAPPEDAPLWAVVRTRAELTVVGPGSGWRAFEVEGPLDLALTGVLAGLTAPLAEAGVPVFAVSSHDTDHLLVPDAGAAIRAWRAAGHDV